MKPIVITGGSRRIGAATARLAARHGYAVRVNFRSRRDEAEKLVEELAERGGQAGEYVTTLLQRARSTR